ncbi:hypothetical protein B0H19DRAFT_25103 [Mycena capillaripes]|nr:hypothetical protein B0H19DRAFT_25103 [Mycena capillaripes]
MINRNYRLSRKALTTIPWLYFSKYSDSLPCSSLVNISTPPFPLSSSFADVAFVRRLISSSHHEHNGWIGTGIISISLSPI